MAKEDVIGLAMQLDVSDIRQGVAEVNKLIKNSKQEFLNATAGMQKWQSTSEGLKSKLTQLNKQLDAQNKLVAGYKAEIERVSKLEGDHSRELDRLKDKLSKAESEVKKTQASIDKYGKSLDKAIEQEKKENSTLGQLERTIKTQKDTLKKLDDEYKNAVIQYGKNSKEAKELAGEIKTLTGELNKNEKQVAEADKELAKLEKTAGKSKKSFNEIANDITKYAVVAFTALAGAIGGAIVSAQRYAQQGDAIAKASRKIGIGVEALQELQYTAGITGVSTESLSVGLATLNKNVGALKNGTGPLVSVLEKMNPELRSQLENAQSTEEAFMIMAKAIEEETEQTNKALLAQSAFGRGGQELIKMFSAGADGIQKLREEAHIYSNVMSEETTTKSEEFNDSMSRLNKSMKALTDTGLAVLVEKLQPLIQKTADWVAENKNFIALKIETIFEAISHGIELVYKGFENGLIPAVMAVIGALKLFTITQTALNVAMNANPIGIIITLCGLLVIAIMKLWHDSEEFRNFFINMWQGITEGVKTAVESIKKFIGNMSEVGKNLVEGLWQGISDTTQWVLDKIKGFGKTILNGIKDFFGIHSPSTVMADVGENLTAGLAVGMERGAGRFKQALDKLNDMLARWREGTGKYISQLGDVFDEVRNRVGSLATAINDYYNAELQSKINAIEEQQKKAQEARELELANARAEADEKIALAQEQLDQQIISEEEFNELKKQIENDYAEFEKEKQAEAEKQEDELNRKKDELARKQFEAQKKNAIAEALINGANAILKGFAQLGPIAGAVNAGIQTAITALQVAVIAKQKYVSAYAKGGIIDKPTLALMGEDGKEAVMPLEHNTGWITELAMKLKNLMEQDFSLAGFNGSMQGAVINNYYYQTINSPTVLSRKEIYRDTKNLLALKG